MDKLKTLLNNTVPLKLPLRLYKKILLKKGKYSESDLNSFIEKIENNIYLCPFSQHSLKPVNNISPLSTQANFLKTNEVDLNE